MTNIHTDRIYIGVKVAHHRLDNCGMPRGADELRLQLLEHDRIINQPEPLYLLDRFVGCVRRAFKLHHGLIESFLRGC